MAADSSPNSSDISRNASLAAYSPHRNLPRIVKTGDCLNMGNMDGGGCGGWDDGWDNGCDRCDCCGDCVTVTLFPLKEEQRK